MAKGKKKGTISSIASKEVEGLQNSSSILPDIEASEAATPPPEPHESSTTVATPLAPDATPAIAANSGAKTKDKTAGSNGNAHGGMEEQQASPFWLATCFFSLMGSGVLFGMIMEYATSGGRKLHELSYIFVTSAIYSVTARVCRDLSGETPTNISPQKLLGLAAMAMASTFTSVRALRYVIFPVQVLAKSCKPVPVMLMGACRGKKYPMGKYANVAVIVTGVALFMGGGSKATASEADADKTGPMMWVGVALLFVSLCFDGATGAYEDELMQAGHLGPFELMYNIQFGKMLIAFSCLLFNNEINFFFQLCYEIGPLLFLLGLSGAMLQVSIFVTISKCGALNCALFGVARKITTLVVSILFFGHLLNPVQWAGLVISIFAMVRNFITRKGSGGGAKSDAEKGAAAVEASVNDGPKQSLELTDQVKAPVLEKKPLLDVVGGGGDDDNEDAFPDAQGGEKV
mmetsp:Transcript_30415/g.61914  ORF Transcript_30415/g.61914 Transcript_30415/m.61914 type:complete len:460 (+) Transcript_30415:58-1437(+)